MSDTSIKDHIGIGLTMRIGYGDFTDEGRIVSVDVAPKWCAGPSPADVTQVVSLTIEHDDGAHGYGRPRISEHNMAADDFLAWAKAQRAKQEKVV